MRVVAILAAHNEERFIGACVEHLVAHGLEVYLLDNESTDRTVEIAEGWLGRGVVGIETMPRAGVYSWAPILERKAQVASELEADWFIHVDADEIRLPPKPGITLVEALAEEDRAGYNAVNFIEFAFVPTRECPDHDHPHFQRTMRRYYPFMPRAVDRLNAWKRQAAPVDLVASGGHVVDFDGLRASPRSFPMRHYLYLSAEHASRKYLGRVYDASELRRGWHRRRAALRAEDIVLLADGDLREYTGDGELDSSNPFTRHPLFARGDADA